MSAHGVSILIVYPCGQTVPGSHHSREFLLTFDGSKVRGQLVLYNQLQKVKLNLSPVASIAIRAISHVGHSTLLLNYFKF